jgi:hypothetical protein
MAEDLASRGFIEIPGEYGLRKFVRSHLVARFVHESYTHPDIIRIDKPGSGKSIDVCDSKSLDVAIRLAENF